jgi:DNA-binding transcriptional MocR family regulator
VLDLRPPPQRRFARQHRIAASTAARVYGELVRRGLAVGDALRPVTVHGTPAARTAATTVLTRTGWHPPDRILFAGNGRQAIAAAVAGLVPVGGRLGAEALTYPVVKAVAARLGVTLVPLEMDEHGLLPSAVRPAQVRAIYVQPTLHNPVGVTMPDARRAALARRDLRGRRRPPRHSGHPGGRLRDGARQRPERGPPGALLAVARDVGVYIGHTGQLARHLPEETTVD